MRAGAEAPVLILLYWTPNSERHMSAKRRGAALFYLRSVMISLALLLPLLSLLPLGWLWLWQQGYALYWLAGALALAACAYVVQAFVLRRSLPQIPTGDLAEDAGAAQADPGWTAREQAAWVAVEEIAAAVRLDELTDRDKVLNLGLRTIEAVARQIHPEDRNPLWKFTVPEALALIERVSADLRPFVMDHIPLGDQLTVGQVLRVYRWRSAIGVAGRAYDLWRLIRLMNPVTAAAQEAREQFTKHLYSTVRDQLARQLTRAYVREVGRAAIDLYGGRLRVSPSALAGHVSASTLRDRRAGAPLAEPLRILVAGRPGAGKSSLIDALSKEAGAFVEPSPSTQSFHAYELQLAGLKSALAIDSPGLGATAKEQRKFAERASECDFILWVIAADQLDDATNRQAIEDIRARFRARPQRRMPPVVVALSHIDKLAPGWVPEATAPAEEPRAVRAAVDAIADSLEIAAADIVPLSVASGRAPRNLAQLRERIASHIPEAQRAQLLRLMEDAAPRWSITRLGKQASNAVVSAARAVSPASILKWRAARRRPG